MIENVNDIYETAQSILDELNLTYTQHLGDVVALPTYQYIAIGGAQAQPHDCEQVTVSMEQMYTGLPGAPSDSPVRCDSPRSAVFYIEVVRKTIQPQQASRRGTAIPAKLSPTEENALAKTQMQDAMLMMEAGLRVGDQFLGSIADVSAGPESGGYQAMTMTLVTGV
jgi:hypothetical protein